MAPEPQGEANPISIDLAETEVLRLIDLEGMYQGQAESSMGVSRGTVWRLLTSAREKVARSIYEERPLLIGLQPEDEI
jgi:predicted DNA-binding protein (UPF0251 family)